MTDLVTDLVTDRVLTDLVLTDLVALDRVAVGFHLVDYVVHAWDVATALGVHVDLPDAAVEAALAVARRVPADPGHRGPGAAFAPPVPAPEGASLLDETLTLLGRTPTRNAYGVARR